MRVFWILTPFDVVAVIYIVHRMISGSLNRRALAALYVCLLPLFLIIAGSGVKNGIALDQHSILLVGILISALKGFALVDDVARVGRLDRKSLAFGFLAFNLVSIFLAYKGLGLSGSGRLEGLAGQSNTLGIMQCFALVAALSVLQRSYLLGISLFLSSLALIFMSGSRGALLSITVIILIYILLSVGLNRKGAVMFVLTTASAVIFFTLDMGDFATYLVHFDAFGMSRIGSFLLTVDGSLSGISEELFNARGNLNQVALGFFLENPTFLGIGYGESASITGASARPHNIFFLSLIELGFFGFLFFSVVISFSGFSAVRGFLWDKRSVFFLLYYVCFLLAVTRTPFFFLSAMPWFVLIGAMSFGVRGRRVEV